MNIPLAVAQAQVLFVIILASLAFGFVTGAVLLFIIRLFI